MRIYESYNRDDKKRNKCGLCRPETFSTAIEENETMFVMPNRVSYDIFEGQRVTDHLMIVPKRHVMSIGEFTDDEHCDAGKFAGKYEQQGYNVYARGVGSASRSVAHQHTHLIKLANRLPKAIMYIEKPYFLLDI